MTRSQLLKARSGAKRREELPVLTATEVMESGIVGMWKGRRDIGSSITFARKLRARLSKRRPN